MYDVWGMCFLGKAYLEGKGTPVDFTQAFAWLQKAIDNGDPEAMCVMGNCYCNGNGVIKNLEKLFYYIKLQLRMVGKMPIIIWEQCIIMDMVQIKTMMKLLNGYYWQ